MNNYIKRFFLMLLVCLATGTVKAQMGNDFAQYDLGLGLDFNTTYSDAQTTTGTRSGRLSFTYNTTPFVNYVIDFQTGTLQGGDALNSSTGRQFTNSFNTVLFRGQLQMGEIIDYSQSSFANGLKNLYISSGVGFIVNHITNINRASIKAPGFYTAGEDNSNELIIPTRIGYEFKFYNKYNQPGFKIDVGYQINYVFGDSVDGFTAGKGKDSYSQFSIGLKFAVGGVATYRKQISY